MEQTKTQLGCRERERRRNGKRQTALFKSGSWISITPFFGRGRKKIMSRMDWPSQLLILNCEPPSNFVEYKVWLLSVGFINCICTTQRRKNTQIRGWFTAANVTPFKATCFICYSAWTYGETFKPGEIVWSYKEDVDIWVSFHFLLLKV